MEKMEVESRIDDAPLLKVSKQVAEIEQNVKTEEIVHYKWIDNRAEGIKTCEKCGAAMRGWAYREKFDYCPKCGEKMCG